MPKQVVIFGTSEYKYLTKEIVQQTDFRLGKIESYAFPDGEHYRRIKNRVEGVHVVLVGGTTTDSALLEIFDLSCAIVKYGANSLTIVMPYFGYSTMERALQSGEVVTAKSRALLLSGIPAAVRGNKIVLMDLHSEGIPYYFEGAIRPVHLHCFDLLESTIKRKIKGEYLIGSTDAGRAKWVQVLANRMGVEPCFVFKKRLDGEQTKVLSVSTNVKGKRVVLYDDMIRTGGSLMGAASAYLEAGATEIIAITTHGLFVGDTLKKLRKSDLFKEIYSTNSHPRTHQLKGDFLKEISIAGMISDYLEKFL